MKDAVVNSLPHSLIRRRESALLAGINVIKDDATELKRFVRSTDFPRIYSRRPDLLTDFEVRRREKVAQRLWLQQMRIESKYENAMEQINAEMVRIRKERAAHQSRNRGRLEKMGVRGKRLRDGVDAPSREDG